MCWTVHHKNRTLDRCWYYRGFVVWSLECTLKWLHVFVKKRSPRIVCKQKKKERWSIRNNTQIAIWKIPTWTCSDERGIKEKIRIHFFSNQFFCSVMKQNGKNAFEDFRNSLPRKSLSFLRPTGYHRGGYKWKGKNKQRYSITQKSTKKQNKKTITKM